LPRRPYIPAVTQTVRGIFLVSAPDRPGLVARLAGFFASRGLNIVDAGNHSEATPARFYMRLVVDLGRLSEERRALEADFAEVAKELSATWSVGYSDALARVAILVTREPGCFYDLVLRERSGELPCRIALVISNHTHLQDAAKGFGVPYVYLPVAAETKREQERKVLDLVREHRIDLVVLARYMQILSADFISAAPPVINIHHGFLPAFQGARPYHQAHARGVKIIGATAHYATADLDQGPIIEQDVARVTHEASPEEMSRVGRDVERVVLARAVRAHLERRVLVEGVRTIVL
jgi:formyltetrahydrofolate deformylase